MLRERSPDAVATALLRIAQDTGFREEVIARQTRFIRRYELARHVPVLQSALVAAGAALPLDPALRQSLVDNLHVTFTGHIGGSYSLAIVNRTMALTMEASRPGLQRLVPWENGPSERFDNVPEAERRQVQALAARGDASSEPAIIISQHYPIHVPELSGHKFAMVFWEETLLPAASVARLNDNFEGVLAPTKFVAKALVDSGLSIPVIAAGYAPDLSEFHALRAKRKARIPGRRFSFLHVSSCFPRKGADALIAAFASAFRKHDAVRLVIKTFPNPHNDIAEQVARLRSRDPEIAEIVVLDEEYDTDAMLELFLEADAMVLPTRGEGFNLPAAEAMASGIPLIVTGTGGHLDFATPDNCRFVDFHFELSKSHLASSASLWVEPDLADLSAALREVHDERNDSNAISKRKAARAAIDIATRLDPGAWMNRLVNSLVDVIATRRTPPRVAWLSSWNVKCGVAEYSRFLLTPLLADRPQLEMTILCDDRTVQSANFEGAKVVPSWTLRDHPSVFDQLAQKISVCDPDAIVIQHQPGLMAWARLAQLLQDRRVSGRITILTLHNVRTLVELPQAERDAGIAALRSATRVLVHQVSDLNALRELGLAANVTYFPQGALRRFDAPPARRIDPDSAPVIGSYGFFLPGKGLHRLIEALPVLRKRWPKIRLRLTNAHYPSPISDQEIERCRKLAHSLEVTDLIEWNVEFQPDAVSLRQLSECDLLVLPYDESKESSSAAVRIALASGAAVAVTPANIFSELGDAVFRFEDISSEATARGIETLLLNHEIRVQLQEDAAAWLKQRDWSGLGVRLKGMIAGLHTERQIGRVAKAWTADAAGVVSQSSAPQRQAETA